MEIPAKIGLTMDIPGNAPLWSRSDAILFGGLLLAAFATRFWRLGTPDVIVFDEAYTVSSARYLLQHLPFRDTHPPLAGILIALSIRTLGDHPWSWRLPGALTGSALVGVTYLLGRRMFNSRPTAVLAAMFVVCDGLFLVDSRIALWEIFYLTSGALAYLMFFRFKQASDSRAQRRALAWMGLALGLGLGSKLLIPAVTEVLVLGFVIFVLTRRTDSEDRNRSRILVYTRIAGAVALVGGLSALVYMLIFVPNYWFGFWHGIGDQLMYYRSELLYQKLLMAGMPNTSSRWWTWPLMLQRPMPYWTESVKRDGKMAVILALNNPIICWGVTVSIPIIAAQAIARRSMARSFLVVGYIFYLAMWAANPRYSFIYHYMPALYLGFLALAVVLAECWQGDAPRWQQVALLLPMFPAFILGLGLKVGLISTIGIVATYLASRRYGHEYAGKFVSLTFALAVLVAFVYLFPVWTGMPLSTAACQARM